MTKIILLDVDGVLVRPGGYRAALRELSLPPGCVATSPRRGRETNVPRGATLCSTLGMGWCQRG